MKQDKDVGNTEASLAMLFGELRSTLAAWQAAREDEEEAARIAHSAHRIVWRARRVDFDRVEETWGPYIRDHGFESRHITHELYSDLYGQARWLAEFLEERACSSLALTIHTDTPFRNLWEEERVVEAIHTLTLRGKGAPETLMGFLEATQAAPVALDLDSLWPEAAAKLDTFSEGPRHLTLTRTYGSGLPHLGDHLGRLESLTLNRVDLGGEWPDSWRQGGSGAPRALAMHECDFGSYREGQSPGFFDNPDLYADVRTLSLSRMVCWDAEVMALAKFKQLEALTLEEMYSWDEEGKHHELFFSHLAIEHLRSLDLRFHENDYQTKWGLPEQVSRALTKALRDAPLRRLEFCDFFLQEASRAARIALTDALSDEALAREVRQKLGCELDE